MPLYGFVASLFLLGTMAVTTHAQDAEVKKPSGPLADYVAKADDSFKWVKKDSGELNGTQYVELILTSQTWRDIPWKHQLFILKPQTLKSTSQAIFLVDGGNWRDELETSPSTLSGSIKALALAANELGAPIVALRHVPQQPMFEGLHEDEIISLTFTKFVETGDSEWPLLLPMVKSVVRGMDAAQAFAKEEWDLDIQHFTVTGASKRGWTTWLTAAVDPRVNAIAPMVIDMLNLPRQMMHQVASFGTFSEQLVDYTDRGLTKLISSPAGLRLLSIVDPYSYRTRITQPKLVILGTNDRYWPADALNIYWDGLVGNKHILYVPNNGHGLQDLSRVLGGLSALQQAVATGTSLPNLTWDYQKTDQQISLSIQPEVAPASVRVWTATSPSRDFREAVWQATEIKADDGKFSHDLKIPTGSFAAIFGEVVYPGGSFPLHLSTTMQIVGSAAGN